MSVDYIILTKTADAVFADYTVNWWDEAADSLLYTETRKGNVGDPIVLSEEDKASRFNSDGTMKFVYDFDDVESRTYAEGMEDVNIFFRHANEISYQLTAVDANGNELQALSSGVFFEGETAEAYYPAYVKANDKWYAAPVTDPIAYATTVSASDIAEGSTTAAKNVTFTETSDIDYFFDTNSMTKKDSKTNAAGASGRQFSDGNAFCLGASSYITATDEIESGTYTVTIVGQSRRSGTTKLGLVTINGAVYTSDATFEYTNTGSESIKLQQEGVSLYTGQLRLINLNEYNSVSHIDYITLKKTGEYDETKVIATGINEVNAAQQQSAPVYNLQGVRVNKMQKGLYIQNGRKFIVK